MADYNEPLADEDKIKIASNFIYHAPPGEFKEVINDVRCLLNNDNLLREHAPSVFSQYSKDQLTPVTLNHNGTEHQVLITEFNDLGNGRFYDPKSQLSFKYDHVRKEASQFQQHPPPNNEIENWRSALDETWTIYCKEHYKNGISSVFANVDDGLLTLSACIEDHQFQPNNYCNGRWRSVWSLTFNPKELNNAYDLEGCVKVQVHYYEDGNVQLVTSKEIKESVEVIDSKQLANEFVNVVEQAENTYQTAITENYQTMSETTFKALRRPLPLTRNKIDWQNIKNYRIGNELKNQ